MTDWERITEEIRRSLQALDEAHEAGEILRSQVTPAAVDTFKDQVRELSDQLSVLKFIFDHESGYSMDELVDVFSQMYSGGPSAYRKSPRLEVKSSKP